MFSARGYNIESLTVADVTAGRGDQPDHHRHRRVRRTSSSRSSRQLDRLVPVHKVTDLTELGPHVERELALVKVAGAGDQSDRGAAARRRLSRPRGRRDDRSFVFEVTGGTEKIDKFIELMGELGLVEIARTGVVAIARGREAA